MSMNKKTMFTYGGLALFGILGPMLFPQYTPVSYTHLTLPTICSV